MNDRFGKGFECLDIEAALTEQQRKAILSAFTTLNPNWQGAGVADILSALDDSDAHLEFIEPWWDDYAERVTESHRMWKIAILALIYCGEFDGNFEPVSALVEKAW